MTTESAATGIILFGHGSKVEAANQGVRDLARRVQEAGPFHHVRAAFLELAQPDLNAAVAEAAEAGLQRVVVIPYFLTEGIHLRRDLPNLIAPLKQRFPRLAIDVGQSLEGHPLMASIILGRVQEVMGEFPGNP
ncbi:MAG TPA: CbiX/SirB N-terminal domain-containing protein [Terriglobia bacterium]|nr:CbiX/SirB N-terminal domain-containing protein [Terriglobia bacterium]